MSFRVVKKTFWRFGLFLTVEDFSALWLFGVFRALLLCFSACFVGCLTLLLSSWVSVWGVGVGSGWSCVVWSVSSSCVIVPFTGSSLAYC